MNANIKMAHIFLKMKYDLKGHLRSYKMIFLLKNVLFLKFIFCLKSNFIKTYEY